MLFILWYIYIFIKYLQLYINEYIVKSVILVVDVPRKNVY